MTTPGDIQPSSDTETIRLDDVEAPDETDETAPIDPEDFAPAAEFSGFEAWCDFNDGWAPRWRPGPDSLWLCRYCGASDHPQRDHEHSGA